MLAQLIFILVASVGIVLFSLNLRKILRNINLGKKTDRTDQPEKRWATMFRVAFGQSKMIVRPIPAVLHFFLYAGFVIINIEVLEIITDGIFGTHRIFSGIGNIYNVLIGAFEILAFLVLLSCVVFLTRRNVLKIKRFFGPEMTAWPKSDANYILVIEILLMAAFLLMNGSDAKLQTMGLPHYVQAGSFPISSHLVDWLPSNESTLIAIERSCWWFHIVGIFAFLNYLPYSKHFHILFAFPNTYRSNLNSKGKFDNMASVTNEVKAMLNPAYVPQELPPSKFGAKDATDLSRVNLMNAYTCTECGRCTSVCPANITGKLLSPRKIMMDTRDRITEIGKGLDKNGKDFTDGKSLLDDYITREEIWACTSCNACVQACPVNIDPLQIIMELRQYAVMEEAQAPASINAMLGNIENNQAPWKYSPADRFNWAQNE